MIINDILLELNMRPSTIKQRIANKQGLIGFELECVVDNIENALDNTMLLSEIKDTVQFMTLFDMDEDAENTIQELYNMFCEERGIPSGNATDPFFVKQFMKKLNLKKFIKQYNITPVHGWSNESIGEFYINKPEKNSKLAINRYIKKSLQSKFSNIDDVVSEASITAPKGKLGIEVITKPLPFEEAIVQLNLVKNYLVENHGMETNSTTGFHINVSLSDAEMDNIDFCKLLVFFDEDYLIKKFSRHNNEYAQRQEELFERIPKSLIKEKNVEKIKQFINNLFITQLDNIDAKYYTFNIRHMRYENYIEFRIVGGDYLAKWDDCQRAIDRCIYILGIASNPDYCVNDYNKKLYKKVFNEYK